MDFIMLTELAEHEEQIYYLPLLQRVMEIDRVETYVDGSFVLTLEGGKEFIIKESPQEVMEILQGIQGGQEGQEDQQVQMEGKEKCSYPNTPQTILSSSSSSEKADPERQEALRALRLQDII